MLSGKNLPKGKTGGYIALATTSIVWGTTWVSSKVGVSQMPAFEMASIRQFLGGICMVGFFFFYKKLPLPTASQFLWLLILAILMFVFANGFSTWSLKYIPTGLSSLIGALYPLSVVIIEMIFFKSRNLTAITFLGLLLGIAGIGIVFYESAFQNRQDGFLFGVFLSAVAMLSWSIGTIVIAKNKININPYYAIGWQMLISSFILLIIALISQPVIPLQEISGKGWFAISYLVIGGSLISFAAFVYSMKKLPVALFSLYAYINPLVAIVTASFVLNEKLTMNILWGALVTLAGIYLVNYSLKQSKGKIIAEPEQ